MTKKYLIRALVWFTLVLGLTVITYFNHQLFIKNSVKEDIRLEEQKAYDLDRELKEIQRKINQYNEYIYEDNRYLLFVSNDLNKSEIILNYVNAPLLKVDALLSSPISITEEMPDKIDWSNNSSKNNIKAVKVSIVFDIPIENLDDYFLELQSSIRCIYYGDFKYTIPTNPYAKLKVTMSYYLFYKDNKTT